MGERDPQVMGRLAAGKGVGSYTTFCTAPARIPMRGIPGLAFIAFNFHIDMVVSLLGSGQIEIHSYRSSPYGYSPCYANASRSKICRDRFDKDSYGYYCLQIGATHVLQ